MAHRLNFSTTIQVPKSKIWNVPFGTTKPIGTGQPYSLKVPTWWPKVGKRATVMFLSPDQSGIYSLILKHFPNEIIIFKHIGTVVEGQQQPVDEEARKWSGATEIYRLDEGENGITLTIDLDVMEEHVEFMSDKLPKALEKIKSNCQ